MQKTDRKKNAESRKTTPWFCCSWLLCLVCSLWEGNSDHSPTSTEEQDLNRAGLLNVSPGSVKFSFLNHHCIFLLLPSVFLVEDRTKSNFSGEISWLHLTKQSLPGCESDFPRNVMLLFLSGGRIFIVPLFKKKTKPLPHQAGRTVLGFWNITKVTIIKCEK